MDALLKQHYLEGPQGQCLGKFWSNDRYELRLISLNIGLTYRYSQIITGLPDKALNEATLVQIEKHTREKLSDPNVPLIVRYPEASNFTPSDGQTIPVMPFFFFWAELESDGTDGVSNFSSLAVLSFLNSTQLSEMNAELKSVLSSLEWAKTAWNWDP